MLPSLKAPHAKENLLNPVTAVTAFQAAPGNSLDRHHLIRSLDDLVRLHSVLGVQVGEAIEEPRHVFSTAIDPGIPHQLKLDLGMPDLMKAGPIPCFAGGDVSPHQIDVCL